MDVNYPTFCVQVPEDGASSEDAPEEGASYVPPPAPPPYTPEFNYSCNNTAASAGSTGGYPLSFALASKGSYLDILIHLLNVVFIHMDLNSL